MQNSSVVWCKNRTVIQTRTHSNIGTRTQTLPHRSLTVEISLIPHLPHDCLLEVFVNSLHYWEDFMVLLDTTYFVSSSSLQGGRIGDVKIKTSKLCSIIHKFYYLCEACQSRIMASIPPSAFSAGRIRETQRDMKLSNIKKGGDTPKVFTTSFPEPSPMKYNSKLMNSIWGFYNRYSPHNVKKVNDASCFNGELQQSAGNSSSKNESMITLPPSNLDGIWATMNVSQAH